MRQDKLRGRVSDAPAAPAPQSPPPAGRPAAAIVRPRRRLSTHARRRQLIETAMRVFAQFGFTGATTKRIAEAAGVTEAVIFQHFADKDALYAAILAHKATEAKTDLWLASLEDLQQRGDDAAVLRAIFERVIARHEQDPHCLRLMVYSALENHAMSRGMQEAQSRRLIQFLEGFVLAGQRAGRFREGSPGVLARAILGMPVYHVFQMRLFRSAPDVDREELIDLGVAFTLAGLARADGSGYRQGSQRGHEPRDGRRTSRRVIGTHKEHTC
jgi:TetR/AcrR family transcriptional regulator